MGIRMITVVTMEIHMGVMVSPAPRMTPDKLCVTPIYTYIYSRIIIS